MKRYKFNRIVPGFLLSPELPDDFPSGGGGGSGGGGTGGGTSGTTSSVVLPSFSISPSETQSVAIGSTVCFKASGSISLSQESERYAQLNVGYGQSSNGVWIKSNGGNVYQYNSEASNSKALYRKQPFYITGKNRYFSTPGGSINNSSVIIGVRSTNNYYYWWEVFKYCNSDSGDCDSRWFGYAKITNPDGTVTTMGGGFVEQNQTFRVKSTGTRIIWEYTTENNWAYNYAYANIPEDSGDFYFFVNGLFMGNIRDEIKTYRGAYQGTIQPDEFIWTTNCNENLTINGDTACYTPTESGACQVCVSTENNEAKCSTIISSPLYMRPKDRECVECN